MTADTMVIDKENVLENRYASTSSKPEQVAATSSASEQQAHVFSPELLSMYYSRLFPFELLHSWLAYDPAGKQPQLFSRREFSFTIEPVPGEEIYIRYQSFAGQQELQDAVCKRRPHKIDIGAIFSHPPKDKNTVTNFATVQRELVFDIDLTDYDEVRHCGCSGAAICGKCWSFMNMAVKVMDQGLKEDFGFERLAWFYSGRRGVHCWVCDESARALSNEARSSVAQYFEVSVVKDEKGMLHFCSILIFVSFRTGQFGWKERRGPRASIAPDACSRL
jgi:DNA primase small subunit